jgi:hypothetical protein
MSKSRALNLPTYYGGVVLSKKAVATKCISTALKPRTLVKTPYDISLYIDGWNSQREATGRNTREILTPQTASGS